MTVLPGTSVSATGPGETPEPAKLDLFGLTCSVERDVEIGRDRLRHYDEGVRIGTNAETVLAGYRVDQKHI